MQVCFNSGLITAQGLSRIIGKMDDLRTALRESGRAGEGGFRGRQQKSCDLGLTAILARM
jgi:hypothetical protein